MMELKLTDLSKKELLKRAQDENIPHLSDKMSKEQIVYWIKTYERCGRLEEINCKVSVDEKLNSIENAITIISEKVNNNGENLAELKEHLENSSESQNQNRHPGEDIENAVWDIPKPEETEATKPEREAKGIKMPEPPKPEVKE